jgi:hypothetical protein
MGAFVHLGMADKFTAVPLPERLRNVTSETETAARRFQNFKPPHGGFRNGT